MPTPRIPPDDQRCMKTTSDGKRCRRLRVPGDTLCGPHGIRAFQRDNPMNMFVELVARDDRLDTARGINTVLGRVLRAFAANQIPARTASTMIYNCQWLLLSLPYLHKEEDREAAAEPVNPILRSDPEAILAGIAETLKKSIKNPAEEVPAAPLAGAARLAPDRSRSIAQEALP